MPGNGERHSATPSSAACGGPVWTIAACVLLAIALGTAWPLLLRAGATVQFDYDEGWNAFRAAEAAHLLPLYGAPPGLAITNYPPLSFHLIGLLSRLHVDVVLAGRLLSLAGLAAVCLAIRRIVRIFIPAGHAADVAALLFFVWLEVLMPSRLAVDDPQLLGMAFETAGFLLVLADPRSRRGMAASALLFAVAVFIKHNLVALPLAAGAGLLLARERRPLLWWVTAGALGASALLALTEAIDGPYFLTHLLRGREYSLHDAARQGLSYVLMFLPVFAITGVWAYRNRNSVRWRPLALGWLFAHGLGFFFLGGDGTGGNMLFEALTCDAIILVLALDEHAARHYARATLRAGAVLALPALFPLLFLPPKAEAALSEWRNLPRTQRQFAAGVALLRQASGPVVCENLLMCYRAGKASAFDPFFVHDQIGTGAIDPHVIADLAESCRLAAVQLGDADVPEPPGRVRFTGGFERALAARYRVALRTPEFSILVPVSTACGKASPPRALGDRQHASTAPPTTSSAATARGTLAGAFPATTSSSVESSGAR